MVFKCVFCRMTFNTECDYQNHVKEVHQYTQPLYKFTCEYCSAKFETLQRLMHHYDTCNETIAAYGGFFCKYCSTKCKSQQESQQVHYKTCVHKLENTTHSSLASTSSDFYKQKFEREQLSNSPIQQLSAMEKSQMFSYEHSSIKIKSQEFREVHGNKCTPIKPIPIRHPLLELPSHGFYEQNFEREQLSNTPIQGCSATEESQMSYEHGSLKCKSLQELTEVDGNKCTPIKSVNLTHPPLASPSSDSYIQKFEREQLSNAPIQEYTATEESKMLFHEHGPLKRKSLQELREEDDNKCASIKLTPMRHPPLELLSRGFYEQNFERELSNTPIQECNATKESQMLSYKHGSLKCKSLQELREVDGNICTPMKSVNLTHPPLASPSSDCYTQKFEREQLSNAPIQECTATEESQMLSYERGSLKCNSLQELREVDGNKCTPLKSVNLTLPSLASNSSDSYKHKKFGREHFSSTPLQICSATKENQMPLSLPLTSSDSYEQKFEAEQFSSSPIQQYSATKTSQVFYCKHCSTKCKSLQEFLKLHGVKCTQRKPINLTHPSGSSKTSSDFYKEDI